MFHVSERALTAAETLISASRVLVCQLEISVESSLEALRLAKRHGLTTIFNPCPIVADLPAEMFELTDILCLSPTEVIHSIIEKINVPILLIFTCCRNTLSQKPLYYVLLICSVYNYICVIIIHTH